MDKFKSALQLIQHKRYLKYGTLFLLICLWGCTKTIKVTTPISASQVVIEGNVYDTAGPYYVTLQRSVEYSMDNNYPPISGAQVTITDSTTGSVDNLTETSSGQYATSSLVGISGHTYLLSVKIGDSIYTSSSTMPAPVKLDSISFETDGLNGKTIQTDANFQDPAGVANYYVFSVYVNGTQPDKETIVYDDRVSDGRYITTGLRLDSSYIAAGDLVTVQMGCVDKNVYNYYNTIKNSTGDANTTPANPISNITNGALGYFSAQTKQTVSAIAHK